MNFVITMAGLGKRFITQGYNLPKYLIKVKNKSLLEWSVSSLPLNLSSKIIFVILKSHNEKFKIINFIKKIYGNFNIDFCIIEKITRGQLETALISWGNINKNKRLLIFNIDTKFNSKKLANNLKKECDGLVGTFNSNEERFSYAKITNNLVIETAEKKVISNNALSGLYMFSDPYLFYKIGNEYIAQKKKIENEYYIAPIYNDLIKMKKKIIIDEVDNIDILGTPEEVNKFRLKEQV